MELRIFGEEVLFSLGPVPVTDTMVTSLVVSLTLVGVGAYLSHAARYAPTSWPALIAEWVVEFFDRMVEQIIGAGHGTVASLVGGLFVFIAGNNVVGQLPGIHPVTGSLATTSALAVVVFLSVPVAGIQSLGLRRYLAHYFRPNPLLLPLHVISELSRTLALAMRLFGNVMSGHLVVGLLVALAGFLVPTPIMALDLLIGLLQAYIFAVLSAVYIGAAVSAGE